MQLANPPAARRILQAMTITADFKKNLELALAWLAYNEERHRYADYIFQSLLFEASDDLNKVCVPRCHFVSGVIKNPQEIRITIF
ncbi:unnamed protein product [Gongylonema pulchrum]|uniref:Uncharacterized protein n=1 Tax=Gongylonema pulchrum TaxID=637853 RepID=A0A3P7NRH4_9BILA|nr:unnamed protein product [Gongylonema pulchrum]